MIKLFLQNESNMKSIFAKIVAFSLVKRICESHNPDETMKFGFYQPLILSFDNDTFKLSCATEDMTRTDEERIEVASPATCPK